MSDALDKAIAENRESALARAIAAPDYLTVYGSKLYGTSTPESDHDERGFTVPPFEYLAGLCRFDQGGRGGAVASQQAATLCRI